MAGTSEARRQASGDGSLERYGFRHAGTWRLSSKVNSGISYELTACADLRVLYAFVIDNRTMYVGVCEKDTTTLKARMGRYQGRQGNGTNRRIAALIRECLEKGKSVGIFAMQPDVERVRYRGLTVDLVKGLENPLIRELNPPWNKGACTSPVIPRQPALRGRLQAAIGSGPSVSS